jgi:hypothetical protein
MSDVSDPDDVSEALDSDVLGEDLDDTDAELPGQADYPPERPVGVEDPSVGGDDDVATRAWRTDAELDGIPDDGVAPDTDQLSAEEAALHITDEP